MIDLGILHKMSSQSLSNTRLIYSSIHCAYELLLASLLPTALCNLHQKCVTVYAGNFPTKQFSKTISSSRVPIIINLCMYSTRIFSFIFYHHFWLHARKFSVKTYIFHCFSFLYSWKVISCNVSVLIFLMGASYALSQTRVICFTMH